MADSKDSKALAKAEKKEAQMKMRELNKLAKSHSQIPNLAQVIARPVVAGASARAFGWMDGRYGDKNPHGASMMGAAVSFVGAIGFAVAGHPTAAGLAADVCAGPVSGMQYAQGSESGKAAKAAAGTAPAAG